MPFREFQLNHLYQQKILLGSNILSKSFHEQPLEVVYRKALLLKISQYSQKNTCVGVFLMPFQVWRLFYCDSSCGSRPRLV